MSDERVFISDCLFGFPEGTWAIGVAGGIVVNVAPHMGDARNDAVDLRGEVVLPGLIDSHVHLFGTAIRLVTPGVFGIRSLDDLDAAIESAKPERGRLNKFMGLDISTFPEPSAVNAAHLDVRFGDAPIIIKGVEGHSALFNTAGLAWFGLSPGRVGVELDGEGNPTGVVRGGVYEKLVDDIYDSYTEEEKLRGLDFAIAGAVRKGVAGIHCLEGYGHDREREFRTILDYARCCPVDLLLYPRTLDLDVVSGLGLPRVGGCELIDGAIGSFSAAMREPYAGSDLSGELFKSDDEVEDFFRGAFTRGLQPCVHVIGDRGIEQCLRVLEGLAHEFDVKKSRPRLEHFIVADDELIARAARLGVASGIQPAFMALWGERGGKYEDAIGTARWELLHRYGTMRRAGMLIGAGSDSHITPIDPVAALTAMVHHENPAERLTFEDAVRVHTEGCAALGMEEKTKGKIAQGYEASFTVLESLDPILENSPDDAVVSSLWVRGELISEA